MRRSKGRVTRPRFGAAKRFRKNPYAHTRPQQQYQKPQVQQPQQPKLPVQPQQPQHQQQQHAAPRTQYGTVNIQQNNGPSGQFQYAQTAPVKPVQLQRQQVKLTTRPASTNQKPLSISMPTLANLLYKYAAKSSKPFFSANPYSMFGAGSYGPMPKPSSYSPRHRVQHTSYQQPKPVVQQPAQSVYRPAVQQAVTYQKPAVPQYQPPATPATPTVYRPPAPQPQQVYQQPAPQPQQVYRPPVATMQYPSPYQQPSGYATPVRQTYQYVQPRAAVQKSYAPPKPHAPTCPAAGNFCYGKKAGHYTHPGAQACFIQCDAFGRGYAKGCSPGTLWKPVGPEPALWNMCA